MPSKGKAPDQVVILSPEWFEVELHLFGGAIKRIVRPGDAVPELKPADVVGDPRFTVVDTSPPTPAAAESTTPEEAPPSAPSS